MMKRTGRMREFCNTWICDISPMAMKVLQENTAKPMKCIIEWNSDAGYEVLHGQYKHVADIQRQTCSCRAWKDSLKAWQEKKERPRKCPLGAPASGSSAPASDSRPAAGPTVAPAASSSSRPPTGPAAGPSSRPSSVPNAAPTSTQTAGPRATLDVAPEQHLMFQLKEGVVDQDVQHKRIVLLAKEEWLEWVYYTHKVVQLLLIKNVKSSAVVTRDLGHIQTCGVKWKGKQALTSSQLEQMRGRKQMETRSKAAHLSQESANAI
ncbi:hypothetical protein EJD97_008404 [Solanum chilense]|uniref:Uncharacterized protein n=1 Tax=Solanum chilense TaxID=4083 RepID=A0A6N2AGR3_SOLCI|nr:hypothetical protein EJD97_008404 [Solanum chilense]